MQRGERLVAELGCESCHRPSGLELANPGSRDGRVPALRRGSEGRHPEAWEEIEEWIRDGHPAALRNEPDRWRRHRERLLHMPAFGDRLRDEELDTLVAWVLVVGGHVRPPEGPARSGEEIARRSCLPCHGFGGRSNPGGLTGYVPALWGPDFRDLVRDEAELKEWIRTGSSTRVAVIPGVLRWWRRQKIRMPAFGGFLSEAEIDELVAYQRWLEETEGGATLALEQRKGDLGDP